MLRTMLFLGVPVLILIGPRRWLDRVISDLVLYVLLVALGLSVALLWARLGHPLLVFVAAVVLYQVSVHVVFARLHRHLLGGHFFADSTSGSFRFGMASLMWMVLQVVVPIEFSERVLGW